MIVLTLWVLATLTYYDPAICYERPINCYDPANPYRMAGGLDAREYYDHAIACPVSFGLGSIWAIPAVRADIQGLPSRDWRCLDRGGMVTASTDGNTITVTLDLLTRNPIVSETVWVQVTGGVSVELLEWAGLIRGNGARR